MSVQEVQTKLATAKREITSIGFWLPVGRSNFFHAQYDQPLLKSGNKSRSAISFDVSASTMSDSDAEKPLNTSVYRRLVTTARQHSYEFAIPYYPDFRIDYLEVVEDTDPDLLLMISREYPFDNGTDGASPESSSLPYNKSVKRIVLSISEDGFYQWLFYHTPQEDYAEFVTYLKAHLLKMVGNLVLYKSEPEQNQRTAEPSSTVDNRVGQESLDSYGNEGGMLNFFQLNLILEGLNNALFDPRLFFATNQLANNDNDREWDDEDTLLRNIELEKEKYSLWGFIKEVIAYTDCVQDVNGSKELVDVFEAVNGLSDPTKSRTIRDNLKQLARGIYGGDLMRRDFLRQFIRKTSSLCLQVIKWNLEDCRRELLPHIISFTHYQHQLVQLPSNDQRSKEFYDVNEAQLSGYVKFVSAKFPLIQNIRRYIELNFENLDAEVRQDISGLYHDWIGRVNAIADNIAALEQALDRVNDDRRLHEQAQIRREQETQAEIARRQQRLGLSSDGERDTHLPSFLNMLLIFIGGVSAVFTISYGISQPFTVQTWALVVILPAVTIFAFFLVLKYVGNVLARKYQNDNRFFHELDLTLEVPMDSEGASTLFERGFVDRMDTIPREAILIPSGLVSNSDSNRLITQLDEELGKEVESYLDKNLPKFPRFEDIEQVSYRYSHGHFNEGTHKVHYEFDIHWPNEADTHPITANLNKMLWNTPFLSNPYIMKDCELVYEVLSHSPSSKVEHVLCEIRFIATYNKKLSSEQVMYLKLKLVNNYVLRWLPEKYQPMESKILENTLPLFSLTVAVLTPKELSG